MAPLEIIGAGFGRTGTDSLRLALNILGYKTHHMKCFFEDPSLNPDDFYNAYHDRDNADWDKMYENYTAAVDWPTTAYWEEVYKHYPDAKIILTVRSADSWFKSVSNTIASISPPPADQGPVDPNDRRVRFVRMAKQVAIDGRVDHTFHEHPEEMKKIFLDHIEYVKKVVPEDKLFVMELGEGWERLCEFLDKKVPDVPYPNVNSTSDFRKNAKPLTSGVKNTE